jgi:hypothetical protein
MPCTVVTVEPPMEWKLGVHSVSIVVKMKANVCNIMLSVLGMEALHLMQNLVIAPVEMDKKPLVHSVLVHVTMVYYVINTHNTANGMENKSCLRLETTVTVKL